jgi:hypothetical protein
VAVFHQQRRQWLRRHVDASEGCTISQLFRERMPHGKAADCLIRVNRRPGPEGHVLQEKDRVSATLTNIEGA